MNARTGAACALLTALGAIPGAARAQPDSSVAKPPWSAQLGLPVLSTILPGFGQYWQHANAAGAAFTTAGLAGIGLTVSGPVSATSLQELPRTAEGQRALFGLELYSVSGYLSAYDSFHRAIPALQQRGMYPFLDEGGKHESVGSLFTAPFDVRFLGRWTTWVDLAYTGAVAALLVAVETRPGKQYRPYLVRDAVFGTGVSFGAGVGEEALFRGWVYPVLYEVLDRNFLPANAIQALFFGKLHLGQAGPFAIAISGWAFYEGWLTRRNHWSIRESIFHHFWYDAVIFATTFLVEEAPVCVQCPRLLRPPVILRFPTITF